MRFPLYSMGQTSGPTCVANPLPTAGAGYNDPIAVENGLVARMSEIKVCMGGRVVPMCVYGVYVCA